jgi:predicted alpha/beta-hydrolase family hydrolase
MLAAEDPNVADALLIQSYPLHPPGRPDQLRTAHLPQLRTPVLFAHGSRDPFGSQAEMKEAVSLVPAPHRLLEIPSAGHELAPRGKIPQVAAQIADEFMSFLNQVLR